MTTRAIPSRRGGFTLIEVILAMVILGAAMAMLGEIQQLASRNALNARAETQAQLLAQSLMDEILAGFTPAANVTRQQLEVEDATPWLYTIAIGASEVEGILPVEVLVEQDLEPQFNPVKFRLLRWLPTVAEFDAAAAEQQSGQQSGSGANSGGGQRAGGSTAGAGGGRP